MKLPKIKFRHNLRLQKLVMVAFVLIFGVIGTKLIFFSRAATASLPTGVTLRQVDGGSNYFAALNSASAWMDQHILLGGWLEQPLNGTDVGYDAAMGNNIYWNLAGHPADTKDCGGSPCRADYGTIRANGMHASAPDYFTSANDKMDTGATNTNLINGPETVSFDGSDESDMNEGPGSDTWNPNSTWPNNCTPAQNASPAGQCGYTLDNWYYTGQPGTYGSTGWPYDSRPVHQGNGKGVLFWENESQGAQFMKYSDIESADSYWITDKDLDVPSQGGCALLPNDATACGGGGGSGLTTAQRQLPANYAYDVTKLEQLNNYNSQPKPIAVDVETGCPGFTDSSGSPACTTPAQSNASAWQALIAGARGIIWFQHNFNGPCTDDRSFMDGSNPASSMYSCQQTSGVTLHNMVQNVSVFNHEVANYNSILLDPFADNYVSTNADVSAMAKYDSASNKFYIFAGSGKLATPPSTNQSATFKVAGNYSGPVTAVDESNMSGGVITPTTYTLTSTNGQFTDTFADSNSVHIYELPNNAGGTSISNLYIAQSSAGTADGSSCANAEPVSFFNTSSNWGTSTGQIGPGTTVHLCGTITTNLTFYGSGGSGSPITLYFEPGANITMPACPGRGTGCINTNGQSYLTIDGGSGGIIQNTADGTHLSEHVGSYAIEALNCSSCEVKNLTIQNIYVHDGSADYTEIDQTAVRAVDFSGSNFLLHDNTIHDVGWAVTFGADGDQNDRVYNNDLYNVDHGFVPSFSGTGTAGPFYIYHNHLHDFVNWDTTSNAYHHDGIHCYSAPGSSGETINGLYVYNNIFDGDIGGHATADIFIEGGTGSGATPCGNSASTGAIFNNIFTTTNGRGLTNGFVGVSNIPMLVYDNDIIGANKSAGSVCDGFGGVTTTVQNNIMQGCNQLIGGSSNVYPNASSIDYNLYGDCTGSYNCWWVGNVDVGAFSSWRAQTPYDAHSIDKTSLTNVGLDANYNLQTGSAAIGAGANLTSVCAGQPNPGLGALCYDLNGSPRPSAGAWDIGAYQYASPITTDLNSDSHVNIFDLSIFLDHLGQTGTNLPGDFNSDGKVDAADLTTLQGQWGR